MEKCKRKKKIKHIFILAVAAVFLLFISIYFISSHTKNNKAKQAAINYLQSKYTELMNAVGVLSSWRKASLYHVYFTPENYPNLTFEVLVLEDYTLPSNPDNYLEQYFIYQLTNEIQEIAETYLDDNVMVSSIMPKHESSNLQLPEKFNETTPYPEMEPYFHYTLFFDIEKQLSKDNNYTEMLKAYKLIKVLQKSSYTPEQLIFYYHYSIGNKINTSKKIYITKWREIEDLSQLDKYFNFPFKQ